MGFFSFGKDNEEEFSNDNYHIRYNNLKSKYDYAIKEKDYCNEQWSLLSKSVQSLCKEILSNKYNTSQVNGESVSILSKLKDVYELIEFTKEDFKQQKTEFIETITKLSSQVEAEKQIIQTLKDEYERMTLLDNGNVSYQDLDESESVSSQDGLSGSNILSEFSMDEPNIEQPMKSDSLLEKTNNNISEESSNTQNFGIKQPTIRSNFNNNRNNNTTNNTTNNNNTNFDRNKNNFNNKNENNNQQTSNFSPKQNQNNNFANKTRPEVQTTSVIKPQNEVNFSIESIELAMNDLKWAVLEVIGRTGYARSNDMLAEIEKIKNLNYKVSISTILEALKSLGGLNLLLCENVRISSLSFNVYSFKGMGIELYKRRFKKDPVESERDKKIRDHDNLQHGYAITHVYELLQSPSFNCSDVTMDRKETSIKLPKGKTYIPDIIADNEDYGKMYIEVELGNTHQNDFNDKCSKMFEVTKNFYFITDVAQNVGWLQSSIDKWITLEMHGLSNVAGLLVRITTLTQLKKGEWIIDKTY